MMETKIFLNKYTKSTLLVFFLMGITYLFLGISSVINKELVFGITQLFFALLALIFLFLSVIPSNSFKLYYSVDNEKVSVRNSLIVKEKNYYWIDIESIIKTKKEIKIIHKEGKSRIRLSALNYNELQMFMSGLTYFISKFNINYKSDK